MPHYHGPHCRLRSFPTKCPECKGPVLYWECSHGVKMFFEYPIYGKPLRHLCQKKISKKKKTVAITHEEHQMKLLNTSSYQCPVCNRIFDKETGLAYHLKNLRKNDVAHAEFFGIALDLINYEFNKPETEEIITQTRNLDLEDQLFDFASKNDNLDQYKTRHNLEPNLQDFYVIKKKKKF
jgi:hypothetical protein